MPIFPIAFGGIQAISHIAQELHFHDVDFLDGYARHFSPSLVGIGIVVKNYIRLVTKYCHKNGENSHLFPNIKATVNSRNSLPGLPLTVGFNFFSRYMNMSANNMTF